MPVEHKACHSEIQRQTVRMRNMELALLKFAWKNNLPKRHRLAYTAQSHKKGGQSCDGSWVQKWVLEMRCSSDLLSILISHKTKGNPERQRERKTTRCAQPERERGSGIGNRGKKGRVMGDGCIQLLKFYQVHIKLKKPWWCSRGRVGGLTRGKGTRGLALRNYCKTLTISVTSLG